MTNVNIKKLRSFNKYYCVFGRMLNTRLPHVYYFTNIIVYGPLYLIHSALDQSFMQPQKQEWSVCLCSLVSYIFIILFVMLLSPKEWPTKPSGVQCYFTQFDCQMGSCQWSGAEIQDHLPAYQWGWPWAVGN